MFDLGAVYKKILKYLIREINSLNGSQYLTRVVFTVTLGRYMFTEKFESPTAAIFAAPVLKPRVAYLLRLFLFFMSCEFFSVSVSAFLN